MGAQLLPIVALLASTFLLLVGLGLQGILMPVRAAIEGWNAYEIGLMGTAYALAFTGGCLVAPRLVRSAGHIRTFSSLAAILAACVLLNGLWVAPASWIAVRAVSGFAIAGAYMVIESWLNERATNSSRGLVFSLYMAVSMAAMMGGQFALPLVDPALPAAFMVCALFYALAVVPNALSRAPSPKPLVQARLDLAMIWRRSPAAVVCVALSGVLSGAWTNMAPVFGQRAGLSTVDISTLLVATMGGGLAFQFPLGRLSDRVDRRLVMVLAGLIGLAAALGGLFLWNGGRWQLFLIAFTIGGVIYPAYSLAVAHANDFAKAADFVKISGGLLILYGFGTMAGPMLAAWLMETFGPRGLFLATGGAHGGIALYAVWRLGRRRETLRPAGKGDFSPVPEPRVTTPETLRHDPRAGELAAEH